MLSPSSTVDPTSDLIQQILLDPHAVLVVMFIFNSRQNLPSQVRSLEEEMVRLKEELRKSEVNRDELSAELMKNRQLKVESRVSGLPNCKCRMFMHIG